MTGLSKNWKLQKYARHVALEGAANPKRDAHTEWKLFEGNKDNLTLTLTEQHHLLITQSHTIQENISLWNCQSWMKGIHKGDSLLIVYKFKDESRRFRVKFATEGQTPALARCSECVQNLAKYFPIRQLSTDGQEPSRTTEEDSNLSGRLPVGHLAQVLSGEGKAMLPLAYQHSNIPSADLSTCVRLCLTDTNFPAFVASVEEQMKLVAQENEAAMDS